MNTKPNTSVMPSATELYDMIMAPIEEDLLTNNLLLLDQKYANETEEEKKKRGERYAAAFQKYEENLGKFMQLWDEELHRIRQEVLNVRKAVTKKGEEKQITDIESQLDNVS